MMTKPLLPALLLLPCLIVLTSCGTNRAVQDMIKYPPGTTFVFEGEMYQINSKPLQQPAKLRFELKQTAADKAGLKGVCFDGYAYVNGIRVESRFGGQGDAGYDIPAPREGLSLGAIFRPNDPNAFVGYFATPDMLDTSAASSMTKDTKIKSVSGSPLFMRVSRERVTTRRGTFDCRVVTTHPPAAGDDGPDVDRRYWKHYYSDQVPTTLVRTENYGGGSFGKLAWALDFVALK